MLKSRMEIKGLPFGERPALVVKQEDVDGYISNLQRFLLLNHIDFSTKDNVEEEEENDGMYEEDEEKRLELIEKRKAAKEAKEAQEKVESSFFLSELYPLSIPAASIPPNTPHYLRDFYVYEDSPPNPIPVPPFPSISEYPQIHPNMTSPLNYHLMNNVSEFKRLKQVYQKIVAKQSGEEVHAVLRSVPSVRGGPFQRNYSIDQLPDFHVDEATCHASLERVSSLLLSHQGFDGRFLRVLTNVAVNQSALSTVTEIMSHVVTSSARLLKAFSEEMGKESTEMEILNKVLAEMGVYDATCLQTYIERDVIGHGKKLHDLRAKLESAWLNSGVFCLVYDFNPYHA